MLETFTTNVTGKGIPKRSVRKTGEKDLVLNINRSTIATPSGILSPCWSLRMHFETVSHEL